MVPASGGAPRYDTIVVIGGGCYGGYYVRQLRRARAAGALDWARLVVVDRDPSCAVGRECAADVELAIAEWSSYLATFLSAEARAGDAIVPSPLMPHLLFEWLVERVRRVAPSRAVTVSAPPEIDGIPWQRAGGERTRYVSFAEWMCPVNCIEPAKCPHTRAARDWSMPPAIRAHVEASRDGDAPFDAAVTFHCTHRAFGVGMIDVSEVLAAGQAVLELTATGPARVLVGTVSHCHGALGVLEVR